LTATYNFDRIPLSKLFFESFVECPVMNFKKLSYCLNWVQFKFGEFLFPVLELIFRWTDNRDSEVKKHFQQAQLSLEKKRVSIAILNLNMVLSIKPSHFLSLVFRGKIYLQEKRFKLAGADFMKAYKINPYRFIHYGLYNDYNSCINLDRQKTPSQDLSKALDFFNQQVTKTNNEISDNEVSFPETMENPLPPFEDCEFTQKERSKFSRMEPITKEEIQETDWDKLSKTLISKTEEQ